MALAAAHRRLTWDLVKQGMHSTMHITSMVVFILVGATCFSLVFQGMDGSLWIEHMLSGIPGGPIGFLIFVNIFIFFLAFFSISSRSPSSSCRCWHRSPSRSASI